MAWRRPTEDDIIATISAAELDGYRNSANWDADPVDILCKRAASLVREYLRTNGNVVMSPDEYSIPESCISAAMDYLAFDVIKRIGGAVTEERRDARKQAIDFFSRISRRWLTPESWQSDPARPSAGPAVSVVKASEHRLTPEKLAGL